MKPTPDNYIFIVILDPQLTEGEVMRIISIPANKSLYVLAKTIVSAFGFDLDHCFGFYDIRYKPWDAKRAFEYFVDIGEQAISPATKGVKKTHLD